MKIHVEKNSDFGSTLHAKGNDFLASLREELLLHGVDLHQFKVDHLCYRVSTQSRYGELKSALQLLGTLLVESMVNGRMIATFRLDMPFVSGPCSVPLLELPSPKPGSDYTEGFEHAEAVIKCGPKSLAEKYPQLNFSVSGNLNTNPEYSLNTNSGKLKFHHVSLDRVIAIETCKVTDVIFDLDGTLVHSRQTILDINCAVFGQLLKREVTVEEAAEKFFPEHGLVFEAFGINTPDAQHEAAKLWSVASQKAQYRLIDGVLQCLGELKSKGVNLHLWTARDATSAEYILQNVGIYEMFTTHSYSSSLLCTKPNAASCLFDWKNAPQNSYVMIGDSVSDLHGARNINAIAAAAIWDGYGSFELLAPSLPEVQFYNAVQFQQWVMALV